MLDIEMQYNVTFTWRLLIWRQLIGREAQWVLVYSLVNPPLWECDKVTQS